MNAKTLAPVVLIVAALAFGPILGAKPKKQDPGGDFDTRIAEGLRLHDAGQYEAAMAAYRDLLKDYPKNPRVLFELALSTLSAGNPVDATEIALRCLKQDSPYDSDCYQIIGNAYDARGNRAMAEEAYRNGLKEERHVALLHFNLGVNLMQQKKTADAIPEFQAGLQEDPGHPGSWRALGIASQMAGQRAHAFTALARFLTIEPDSQRSSAAVSQLWALRFQGVESTAKEPGAKPGDVRISTPPSKEGEDPEAAQGLSISLVAASRWMDEWRDRSDAQFFAHAFQQVLAILTELDANAEKKDPFWSVATLPYFREARAAGHFEAMAWSIRRSLKEPETLRWLADHAEAIEKFQAWSGAWKPVGPAVSK